MNDLFGTDEPQITMEELRTVVARFITEKDKTKAQTLAFLKKYGAAKLPDLKPDQITAMYKEVNLAIEKA